MSKNTDSEHNKVVLDEWKRKEGYKMIDLGMKNSEISRKLNVDRRTVYNWRLRKDNGKDWKRKKNKGAKPRLSSEDKEKLKKIIDSGALSYGYNTDLWTLKRISEVIENEFNVHYNTTYIWQLLDTMGYSA